MWISNHTMEDDVQVLTVLIMLSMPASLAMTGAEMRSGVPISCTCRVCKCVMEAVIKIVDVRFSCTQAMLVVSSRLRIVGLTHRP